MSNFIYGKNHKYNTKGNWRFNGVVYPDFDELYYIYINTMKCSHCDKEFKNSRDRNLDHDHETGLFRAIVCHRCNSNDLYIRRPKDWTNVDYKKEWYENNKKRVSKYRNGTIDCPCGISYSLRNKSRHHKSFRHIDWFMEQVD